MHCTLHSFLFPKRDRHYVKVLYHNRNIFAKLRMYTQPRFRKKHVILKLAIYFYFFEKRKHTHSTLNEKAMLGRTFPGFTYVSS